MPTCWVCGEKWWRQTDVEPAEGCPCGEGEESLSDYFTLRGKLGAIWKHLRWMAARRLWVLADKLLYDVRK